MKPLSDITFKPDGNVSSRRPIEGSKSAKVLKYAQDFSWKTHMKVSKHPKISCMG